MNPIILALVLLLVFIVVVIFIKKLIDKLFLSNAITTNEKARIKPLRILAYVLLPLGIAGVVYLLYQDVISFNRENFGVFIEFISFANTLIWFIPAILFIITVATLERSGSNSQVLNVAKLSFLIVLAIHAALFLLASLL